MHLLWTPMAFKLLKYNWRNILKGMPMSHRCTLPKPSGSVGGFALFAPHTKFWLLRLKTQCNFFSAWFKDFLILVLGNVQSVISQDNVWMLLTTCFQGSLTLGDYVDYFKILAKAACTNKQLAVAIFYIELNHSV